MTGLPLVGDEFAGYRTRAVLGRGGMSVVYQAENLRLSSVIALKVLAPELAADDVFRTRFLEESRIAASLNHPNVIPIYDMGSQDELLYIAMRYKHAMSRSGLTSTGQFLGTIDYVAPEQIRGTSVLGLADQYSLGCVLYECLTGRVPFEKDLDAAIIWAHVEETPAMPTVLRPDLPPEVDEVFGRVLAKRPDERYGSCREFVDAARMALGVLGTGTGSALAYGVTTAGPQTGPPPGSRAGTPPDQFSWGDLASRSHPPGPAVDPVAPAAAAASGVGQSGGTLTSHRRDYGIAGPGEPGQSAGTPPPPGQPKGPRWYRQPRWLAALAAAVVLLAGVGTWAGLSGSGSHARASTMPSTSPKPRPTTSALMNAIILTNKSAHAQGLLPPSTCKQASATHVTCTAPAAGISGVVFQTYPDQKALYAAYTAEVSSLNSGKFRQDFADCGSQATYGEVGWNHLYQHTRKYTVDQMTMGLVTDDQAAGRVSCTYTQGLEYMVWASNDSHLMGYVAGQVHADVWNWWVAVHHDLSLGGPMNMLMPAASASGAGASPAMSPSPSMSSMAG